MELNLLHQIKVLTAGQVFPYFVSASEIIYIKVGKFLSVNKYLIYMPLYTLPILIKASTREDHRNLFLI